MAKLTPAYRQAALRRGIVVKTNKPGGAPTNIIHAAALEMANFGFLVNPEELADMSIEALTGMLQDARVIIGADRHMIPIYPGFPKQVEELPTLTLLVEQLLHYWTGGTFLPDYPDIVREGLPLEDMLRTARKVTVLSAASTAREVGFKLATDPIALSEDDRTLLKGSLELQHPTLAQVSAVAKAARNGENLQTYVTYVSQICDFTNEALLSAVAAYTDNLDQLLRVVLTLVSEASDVKWEENYKLALETLADRHARAVKLNKLSRPLRRLIIERVGVISNEFLADRLVARQDLWRRVMRAVHPYDFTLTPAQKRAVDIIHSNGTYRTFNSLVEDAMETGKVKKAVKLLAKHQPGNLLRRTIALLRLVKNKEEALVLAEALRSSAKNASLTTLVSAYNGIISANDSHTRVTRVAGLTNTMVDRAATIAVKKAYLKLVASAVRDAIVDSLGKNDAPSGPVAIESTVPVPLVRRDAATADRVLDRGQELALAGEGDVLRIFGHWRNNQNAAGYMDIGVVVLDKDFKHLGVSTWNTWENAREWSTYSGDCNVAPGKSAAEFIDVKLKNVRELFPEAAWVAMSVQSWNGWPMANVDFIAGAMLRSRAGKGGVFDPRSVVTAFKPTTTSTQAVPFAVNLGTGKLVWIDSSSGSTAAGSSASNDAEIGSIVYDELGRPRLTLGELAQLWAQAHNVATVAAPVDREVVLGLLG